MRPGNVGVKCAYYIFNWVEGRNWTGRREVTHSCKGLWPV